MQISVKFLSRLRHLVTGKSAKGAKQGTGQEEEDYQKAPHSFVFHRGKVGKNVSELERDIRRVMEPYTAKSLKVSKRNVLKDFVSVAGPLNVSHFMVLSKTDVAVNLRVIRLPRGPTLTFKVHSYSLAKDIITSLKRHVMEPKQFQHHPLLVMNNMSGEGMHIKLMATMFQNMFPSINVNKVKLKALRRCVLLSYNDETKAVDFRHYNIKAVPVGLGRGVKKLTKTNVPNLSKYDDISEFLLRGDASESEAEVDGPHNEVELPQDMANHSKVKTSKSAIRLTEIGPRLSMQLIKVEEGICEGNVLFHEFIQKTEGEIKEQVKRREKKMELKAQRKKEQGQNIDKKKLEKEEIKKKTLAGMKKEDSDSEVENPGGENDNDSDIDDIEYYKQEVGETPDAELFPQKRGFKRKSFADRSRVPQKKNRKSQSENYRDQHGKKTPTDNKYPNKAKGKFTKKSGKFEKGDMVRGTDKKFSKNKKDGMKKKGMDRKQGSSDKKRTFEKKKKVLTDLDRMKRSKAKREQKKQAKIAGKRRNIPRKS